MEVPILSNLYCSDERSLSSHYNAHDVAIACNNAGVTMLQNSCYLLACESFRDAVHVMKLATANDNNQAVNVDIELSNKMLNLRRRLVECHRMQESESNTNCSRYTNLSILKYDGTVSSISKAAIDTDILETYDIGTLFERNDNGNTVNENLGTDKNETTSPSTKHYAIHIVDHHVRYSSYEMNTAIILYNYGIAFSYNVQCQSILTKSGDQDIKDLMNKSKRLFLLSCDILHHLSSIDNDNDTDDNDETLLILLLSCLVTMALFKNSIDSGTRDEAFHCYRFIRHLRNKYEIITLEFIGGSHAAAA